MIDLDEEQARMKSMLDRRERMALGVTCTEMIELITRLRQAEKDAERYRWLRESTHFDSMQHQLYCLHYGERLDIAIDEAMQCNGDNK